MKVVPTATFKLTAGEDGRLMFVLVPNHAPGNYILLDISDRIILHPKVISGWRFPGLRTLYSSVSSHFLSVRYQ